MGKTDKTADEVIERILFCRKFHKDSIKELEETVHLDAEDLSFHINVKSIFDDILDWAGVEYDD